MSLERGVVLTLAAVAIACLGLVIPVFADDAPPKSDTPPKSDAPALPPAKAAKPMKMTEPMAGEMKKDSMTKGDVKKAAEKKDRDMKEMMEKEEKAMKKGG